MFKEAIIITMFFGLAFQSFAVLPNVDFSENDVNFVITNIIQPIQTDRNSVDLDVYTTAIVGLKMYNSSNVLVYSETIENVSFHKIDTSNLPLGTYTLEATSGSQFQEITIVLEE